MASGVLATQCFVHLQLRFIREGNMCKYAVGGDLEALIGDASCASCGGVKCASSSLLNLKEVTQWRGIVKEETGGANHRHSAAWWACRSNR